MQAHAPARACCFSRMQCGVMSAHITMLGYYNIQRGHMVCCPAGFVSARLRGDYSVTRDDRIDLEFRNITLNVGPFKAAEKVGCMQSHVVSCAMSVRMTAHLTGAPWLCSGRGSARSHLIACVPFLCCAHSIEDTVTCTSIAGAAHLDHRQETACVCRSSHKGVHSRIML